MVRIVHRIVGAISAGPLVALCYSRGVAQPVKVSDELLLDARLTGAILKRSIAGQIEFWAALGRAIEPLLDGARVVALQQAGTTASVADILGTVDTPAGRRRTADVLQSRPFPHYEAAPGRPGMLVRIDESGRRTVGRFFNRRFKAGR